MVDEDQLSKLIECLDLNSPLSLLDLGCGIGKVAEYVSDTTGVKVMGLDYAPAAIQAANDRTKEKRDRIRFVNGNINNLKSFRDNEFDAIMSIDAIMFASDLSECVCELKRILKPGGTLAIIYHTHNRDNKISEDRLAQELPLGKALLNSGLSFQAFDFTANEKAIWKNTLQVANELKEDFVKEGNLSIFKQRVNEATKVHKLHEQGLVARYLYVVRNS
jgi:ubiquinone/menaquinone biosynthesis C-methylase UbiE